MVQLFSYWGISSQLLVEEAENLGLTVDIVNKEKNLFYISDDKKEILFKSTDCGLNSSLGLKIANDKELTYDMLERNGLPVAHTMYLAKDDFDEDINDIGFTYPLVVKPLDGAHGDGVMMNIQDKEELVESLNESFDNHSTMIIQDQVAGDEFRILVLQGKVVLAIQRQYPIVVGDGSSTILELIETENSTNELRGDGYENALGIIKIDEECKKCLKTEGYNLDSVLADGQSVMVRRNSNLGTGGTVIDVTHTISKMFSEVAIKAAQACGLQLAGVDLLTTDITSSDSSKCTILEIGATPGIGGHRELTSINTGKEILEILFSN